MWVLGNRHTLMHGSHLQVSEELSLSLTDSLCCLDIKIIWDCVILWAFHLGYGWCHSWLSWSWHFLQDFEISQWTGLSSCLWSYKQSLTQTTKLCFMHTSRLPPAPKVVLNAPFSPLFEALIPFLRSLHKFVLHAQPSCNYFYNNIISCSLTQHHVLGAVLQGRGINSTELRGSKLRHSRSRARLRKEVGCEPGKLPGHVKTTQQASRRRSIKVSIIGWILLFIIIYYICDSA